MGFRQENEAIDGADWGAVMERTVGRITTNGRDGIGEFQSDGKVDRSVLTYRNFWMSSEVKALGEQLARKNENLSPHQWANWMVNTNVRDGVIYVSSRLVGANIKTRFGYMLDRHFGKQTRYEVQRSLRGEI